MSTPIATSGLVPLCFIAHNRDETLFVRAKIFDVDGNLLDTKTLAHTGEGRYTNATYFYPSNEPSIKIHYDPFTDAGFTTPSPINSPIDERFHELGTPSEIIRNDEIELIFDDTDESIELVFSEDDSFDLTFSDDESFSLTFEEDDESIDLVFSDSDSFELTFHDC